MDFINKVNGITAILQLVTARLSELSEIRENSSEVLFTQ